MRCFVSSFVFTAVFIAAILATAQDFQVPGNTAIENENGSEDAIIADSVLTHIAPWDRGWRYEDFKLLGSDVSVRDHFGRSVSVSSDVAVIGTVGGNYEFSGSVYVFRYDSGTQSWAEEQELLASDGGRGDFFGQSVSISGNIAVIGAYWTDNNYVDDGSAYVFRYDSGTQVWTEEEKLLASNSAAHDLFGGSVSVSGGTALVGAARDDNNGSDAGSACIFRYDSGTQAWTEEEKLLASDGAAEDRFGQSVSISGDVAVIGAPEDDDNGYNAGSAYIFRYDSGTQAWTEEEKLLASDGAVNDLFGLEVSVSGGTALVGARYDDDNGSFSGSAYVFRYDMGTQAWIEKEKLLASDGEEYDEFGHAVSISGDIALVGAQGDDDYTGSAYVFHIESD